MPNNHFKRGELYSFITGKASTAIARRLHHCRDLEATQPFDFITYFDFAPAAAKAFDEMLAELRATEEWKYIDREVDIRLERTA